MPSFRGFFWPRVKPTLCCLHWQVGSLPLQKFFTTSTAMEVQPYPYLSLQGKPSLAQRKLLIVNFKLSFHSQLKAIVKDFPRPRQDKENSKEKFRLVWGTYNPGWPDIYQLVHMLQKVQWKGQNLQWWLKRPWLEQETLPQNHTVTLNQAMVRKCKVNFQGKKTEL